MKTLSRFFRLLHIQYVFAKYGLDKIFFSLPGLIPLKFLSLFNPWNWFRRSPYQRGEALRMALEELGPIFVKFGQALSTRHDLLPDDIAVELSKLQDCVPPFDSSLAKTMIEDSLGQSLGIVFRFFDDTPLASASIAQVHAAILLNGKNVVVKVLRPGIRKQIQRDLGLIKMMADLAEKSKKFRRFKPKAIVHEFELTLFDELDLPREAANAAQLKRNFQHSSLLYIPEIEWQYTKEHIIVMERIYGIPIADLSALKTHGINLKKLAENSFEIFLTQVFRDAFFHADLHPGNIFVAFSNPEDPQSIYVDFGIIGTLNEQDKRYIAENLYAFLNRDYRRVAELHVESGWLDENVRVDRFESAIRTVSEPIFEKPLKDISLAQLILRLIQTAQRFHINIQPQLILLQKTLLAIEGLGRYLYPNLDLWATAKPFLERWIQEQIGPQAFFRRTKDNLPFIFEKLPEFPKLIYDYLQQTSAIRVQESKRITSSSTSRSRFLSSVVGIVFLLTPPIHFIAAANLPLTSSNILGLTVSMIGLVILLFSRTI